ncbi:hypothetical protein [Actinomadura macrotermitis]|uniref:Uncharacterized protein n=1 Tax=Actinomadura macrotermitis TaxID=2585200 RepID=A0A7K0BQU6_9ACTN|nr:hypothetical protein [Actinomadura macrotermitis]MQY03558.1 hypothetical protein [Actinomadura macrotermitis]
MSRAEIRPPEADDEPDPARRGGRAVVALVAAAGCAAVLVAAGARLAGELTRDPTPAEVAAAGTAEIAARYRTWPAGRIFPERIGYTLDLGPAETARRVGIDPGAGCADGVDPRLGATLTARRCRAVLRAGYLDQLQGLAVTVGVVAFPDEARAREAAHWFAAGPPGPGLRALSFPGSVTARFGDAARQASAVRQHGPYVVAATVGYADGRPAVRARRQEDLAALGPQLAEAVLRPLTRPAAVRCGTPEWSC